MNDQKKKRQSWDDNRISAEIHAVAATHGYFPSNSELMEMGRGDLASAINRSIGFMAWSERLNIPRRSSDSDFGWDGEKAVVKLFNLQGLPAIRSDRVKAPFDVLVGGVLRVDVKNAVYAEYGPCRGWFYRIGKIPQADIVILHQADTGDFYGLPWHLCPTSNVTISRDGGKYAAYFNNWELIRLMLEIRRNERDALTKKMAHVA